MLQLIEQLKASIAQTVYSEFGLEIDQNDIVIETPQNEKFGDYSSNVSMTLAKKLNQNPFEIAKKLSYRLESTLVSSTQEHRDEAVFDSIDAVAPGFINFHFAHNWLLSLLNDINTKKSSYGSNMIGLNKKVALEHSNVNPNKAPHIGHLRNAALGQFIEKIYEYLGHDVQVQYYSNDVGVQVATSFLGVQENPQAKPENYPRFDYYAWDVYAEISNKLITDEALKIKLETILKTIEDPNLALSKDIAHFADKILFQQLDTFWQLGIDYDVIVHERDIVYTKMWEACFELLKENPNFYLATEGKSKGCWLLKNREEQNSSTDDFEKDKIIVRSNGVPTYTGKDIAYHMWKFGLLGKDFSYKAVKTRPQTKELWETSYLEQENKNVTFSNSDIVIDVIDQKQTYAIAAVKESLVALGHSKAAQNMHHVNYGFVYLSLETAKKLGLEVDENASHYEMSGRKGVGIKILDFVAMVDKSIQEDYGSFDSAIDVRNGAIKFELLKYNTFNDIVFDLDTALNLKGFSGPYLQYTHARICSVLAKAQEIPQSLARSSYELNAEEALLIRHLAKFDEIVLRSAQEFAPNLLCDYLFRVGKLFNAFYNDHSIMNAQSATAREFRLYMAQCTRIVISSGLSLLGIEAPEKV